jgi:hypothetical protein
VLFYVSFIWRPNFSVRIAHFYSYFCVNILVDFLLVKIEKEKLFVFQVIFERDVEGSPIPKQVKRTLFGQMNPYPQKKILTFNKHQNDFSFYVSYAELDNLPPNEIE